jgi:hypothetical protein
MLGSKNAPNALFEASSVKSKSRLRNINNLILRKLQLTMTISEIKVSTMSPGLYILLSLGGI